MAEKAAATPGTEGKEVPASSAAVEAGTAFEVKELRIREATLHFAHKCESLKGEDFVLIDITRLRVPEDQNSAFAVFAVFDGHNGPRAAKYANEHLLNNILGLIPPNLNRDEWLSAILRATVAGFVKTDKDFVAIARSSGTTVTFVVVDEWVVTVASVGDSRCILQLAEGAVSYLSADHRLDSNEDEVKRIVNLGGRVQRVNVGDGVEVGPLRCWPGGLALSRSIGDRDVGPYIVPVPYVKQVKLPKVGGRIVIASDGVWDALTPDQVVDCSKDLQPEDAAKKIIEKAVDVTGLRDDTTCIVVNILPAGAKQAVGEEFSSLQSNLGSSNDIIIEGSKPDDVVVLFEDGSALLSERLDSSAYRTQNKFSLMKCAICQADISNGQGISIHSNSEEPQKSHEFVPLICKSCQRKKEYMEGIKRKDPFAYAFGGLDDDDDDD